VLNYPELVDYYTARQLHHFLALLHAKFLRLEHACAVWDSLVRGHVTDPHFPGLAYFCQRLAALAPEHEELLWTHADACLERYRTGQCCGSGSGIRCLFDPWLSDPGSQTRIFESLVTIFWVKSSFLENRPTFFFL
jgi:hypothetical protein